MTGTETHLRQREEFIARHGRWNDALQAILEVAPEFLGAFDDLLAASTVHGTLAPKDRALIAVSLTATPTNLFAPALRANIRDALAQGATRQEIVEVFQLVSALGLHSCTFGVPVLFEEAAAAGAPIPLVSDSERAAMKEEFIRIRGYWGEFWDQVLALSPKFFRAYLRFSAVPWEAGHLAPKLKELIYIAIDSNTTHLYEQGLRVHLRNAMRHGATPAEIIQVLQLASTLGMQSFELGMPILDEEIDRRAATP
ncbi:carboxymuconolactone decarboxylase family protein [Xenophilus azovorans]|uniref:carboxymuconolactone decarboxylase family protein n=1 Tax=Xenophilus azovorans TaxID=151755 RepID=UPI00056FE91C|nr:carboxymuconolactone decarboxylase family protein [Xenophilus azovorans]